MDHFSTPDAISTKQAWCIREDLNLQNPERSRFYGPLQLTVSASHAHLDGESVASNPRHPKVFSLSGRVP
jgi:hypothetical protein